MGGGKNKLDRKDERENVKEGRGVGQTDRQTKICRRSVRSLIGDKSSSQTAKLDYFEHTETVKSERFAHAHYRTHANTRAHARATQSSAHTQACTYKHICTHSQIVYIV